MSRSLAALRKLLALSLCAGLLTGSWPLRAQEAVRIQTEGAGVSVVPAAAVRLDPAGPGAELPVLGADLSLGQPLSIAGAGPTAGGRAAAVSAGASVSRSVQTGTVGVRTRTPVLYPAGAGRAPSIRSPRAETPVAGNRSEAVAPGVFDSLERTGAELERRQGSTRVTLDHGFDARALGLTQGADGTIEIPDDSPGRIESKTLARVLKKQAAPAKAKAKDGETALKDVVKGLARLRRDVQKDARGILNKELGGDVGDGKLHRDVERVLRRLLAAAGVPPEAAQIFIGNSYLPNGFTTVAQSEAQYFDEHASIAKGFRIANVFLSLGLLRAAQNEEQLALVIAHELMHNWKGHLKDFSGAGHVFLGHFHELEADAEGLKLAAKAGYDPRKAIDMLYALDAEYDRLEKDYALLGREKNDVLETLQRLRDIHPHADMRKANMLEHMNEALESYKPRPVPSNPVWMRRRSSAVRPTHLDRFEKRLKDVIKEGDVEANLHNLEALVAKEAAKRSLAVEEYAIIEEGYRALAKRAKSPEELRFIEVSARRSAKGTFPSRRLKASLITRQLDLATGRGKRVNLLEFEKLAANLGVEERLAGTLRILGSIETREELDAAYRALSREAENLGLDLARIKGVKNDSKVNEVKHDVAVRLWRATRDVLTAELKRPAAPEEIVAELTVQLAPAWLKDYHEALQAEILETAFQPEVPEAEVRAGLAKSIPGFQKLLDEGRAVFQRGGVFDGPAGPAGDERRELERFLAKYESRSRVPGVYRLGVGRDPADASKPRVVVVMRESYRSAKYKPSQLSAMLKGRKPEELEKFKVDEGIHFDGIHEWTRRHWTAHSVETKNFKILPRYERFYLDGLTSPSLRDQLDIAWRFWNHEPQERYFSIIFELLPKPFVELLRREGRLDAFLDAMMDEIGGELKRKLAEAATEEQRREALRRYSLHATMLLESALQGTKEVRIVRETVAAIWGQTEALLGTPEVNAAYAAENKSYLGDVFFGSMSDALRRAIMQADTAGFRPDSGELAEVTKLARRIDALLKPYPVVELVKAHAKHLGANLDNDKKYMLAFKAAEPHAVRYSVKGLAKYYWWPAVFTVLASAGMFFGILPGVVSALAWAAVYWAVAVTALIFHRYFVLWRATRMPGLPPKVSRSLGSRDFVHFLAILGDPKADADTKLMSALLLDRLDLGVDNGKNPFGEAVGMHASTTVGRWLLEDAVGAARSAPALEHLAGRLLRVNELHPGFLQPDARYHGTVKRAFRNGAVFVRRNEPLRAVAKGQHPFRGINSRWATELAKRLDGVRGWPKTTAERLDLLDLMNSNGEFNDDLDGRVLDAAEGDPEGFNAWVKADRKRNKTYEVVSAMADDGDGRDVSGGYRITTPFGEVPLPHTEPLRIVRNPAMRTRLFDLLPESKLGEKARLSWKQRWEGYTRLWKAFWLARKYFSIKFLKSMRHEGSLEEKFIQVLEEADRYAAAEAEKARERWEKGKFPKEDQGFLKDLVDIENSDNWKDAWNKLLPHEKQDIVNEYKRMKRDEALSAIYDLYTAYAGVQEPVLGLILDNYPEPTRSRDALLERVMKARRLTPGKLAFLEGNKSYRQPNPVRIMEKHLMEAALVQIKKFSPAERVDILLHLSGVEKLSKERMKAFNERVLSGDRKKLARDYGAIRGIEQLQNYMSLLHAKDRSMLVRAQFHGEQSLHKAPAEVERLFSRLVIDGRDLPRLMQVVLRTYFKILTDDEKSKLIGDLAAFENVSKDLKGPQIIRVALKGMGVTGAKIAQVLATHKGLLPPEYAAELEGFKDKAQDMEKMRAFTVVGARIAAIAGVEDFQNGQGVPSYGELDAWTGEALPELAKEKDKDGKPVNPAARSPLRRLITRQVEFLLKEQGRWIRSIESLGRELGSGSIKVVYKVTLDDGRVWVVKLRSPGTAYSIDREFEIIEHLVGELEAQGELDVPGVKQLMDEVKALVRAEMNFVDEAKKETAMKARIAARPWYARVLGFSAPYVPTPHKLFVSEDLMVEEFVHTMRFNDLPRRRLLGPSQKKIAALSVREGMFALVFEGWLEPDPHTGNRHARKGWLHRFFTRLVLMDLGQGEAVPIERLKAMMKAASAYDGGDLAAAAEALLPILSRPPKKDAAEIRRALRSGLDMTPGRRMAQTLRDAAAALAKRDLPAAAGKLSLVIETPHGMEAAAFRAAIEAGLAGRSPQTPALLAAAAAALDRQDLAAARAALERMLRALSPKAPALAAAPVALAAMPDGVIERLLNALVEAEKLGALVQPEYASLQKAFVIYMGYSQWLPKDYIFRALQDAGGARMWRDHTVSRRRLLWLGLKRAALGPASIRAETDALIDKL